MSGTGAVYDNLMAALSLQSQQMAHLQEMASSGLRINRPSDDPADAFAIMGLESQAQSLDAYKSNVANVTTDLGQASTNVQSVSDSLTQIKSLLTQAASGTYGSKDRQPIAAQINSILEEAVSLANYKNLGRYVFSGATTSTQPYAVTRSNGQITSVVYQGSSQELDVPVAPGVKSPGTLVGSNVFSSTGRQAPIFYGATGAKAGSTTSTAHGDLWLTLTHASTTYAGTSGVAAGAGSAEGDTILGAGHKLTIDAANKTVQLDSGPVVTYGGSDTNLKVSASNGDTVYLDMTGVTAATGTLTSDITATANASLDDGTTTQAIGSFTDNIAVTDPRTGGILYVDGRAIGRTGVEPVRIPGTYDLFNTLVNVRDVLSGSKKLSADQQSQLINEALASIDEVSGGVTKSLTSVGARINALDNLDKSLDDLKTSSTSQSTTLKDADVIQVATDLSRVQTFYQMTLAASARTLNLSLLDYIK